MFQSLFQIDGVVKELRELTSQKNKNWRGYRCKVATLGAMLELTINHEQYKKLGEGHHMAFVGEIEQQGDYQSLVVKSMKPFNDSATKPSSNASDKAA